MQDNDLRMGFSLTARLAQVHPVSSGHEKTVNVIVPMRRLSTRETLSQSGSVAAFGEKPTENLPVN
jgi:hypothetical protein